MMRKQKEGLNHSEVNPEPVQTVRCCSAVLVLCIFPETLFNMEEFIHLIIVTLETTPGATLTGEVEVSEMMGSSVHLHLNTLGRDVIVIVPTLDLKDNSLGIGSKIRFTFAPNAVHVFDPESGKNLEFI